MEAATNPASASKDAKKVYVAGLPFSCDKRAVREHFSSCGEIEWLHMPLDAQERPRGIAFVSFWTQESVTKALQLHGTFLGDHVLKVNMAADKPTKEKFVDKLEETEVETPKGGKAKSVTPEASHNAASNAGIITQAKKQASSEGRKIFIGGVPFKCSADVLRKDFSECGEIQQLRMPLDEDGRTKGVAFVTYKSEESVGEALKFHNTEYGGCTLTVRLASDKVEKGKNGPKQLGQSSEPDPCEAIVKGLPFGTKEDVLRESFAKCGTIKSLRMPLNKKGKSYGFAFIIFDTVKGVKRALKLSGTEIGGRPCNVERVGEGQNEQGRVSVEGDEAMQAKSNKRRALQLSEAGTTKSEEMSGNEPHPCEVFVTGLACDIDEIALREFFSKCGDIKSVRLRLTDVGSFSGSASIAFETAKAVRKALKLSQTEIVGVPCTVVKAGAVQSELETAPEECAESISINAKRRRAAPMDAEPAEQELLPEKNAKPKAKKTK